MDEQQPKPEPCRYRDRGEVKVGMLTMWSGRDGAFEPSPPPQDVLLERLRRAMQRMELTSIRSHANLRTGEEEAWNSLSNAAEEEKKTINQSMKK